MVGNGEHRIEELLDLLVALVEAVLADALGVLAGTLDHLPVGRSEPDVVLEEVCMPKDVRDNKLVVQERVGVQEKGIAGVGIDHQFVNLAKPIVVIGLHRVVRLAVRPVAEPAGQQVRPELVENGGGHDLKVRGERIQPHFPRLLPDDADRFLQPGQVPVVHRDAPPPAA